MNKQTIIFIGRSGAGKGVQSDLLKKYFAEKTPDVPIFYLETGVHFRKQVKESGYTWDRARIVNEVGGRQPDFLAVWIWSQLFIDELKGNEHLICDGTPRSLGEAQMLSTALPFYERTNPTVVLLDVSRAWAEERLRGRGRADDVDPAVVARRLAWYEDDVVPAVEYYRQNSMYRFLHINGEQTPEEVRADILKGLEI